MKQIIWTFFLLTFCIFPFTTLTAKESLEVSEEKRNDIVGYGEYTLSTNLSKMNLSGFKGPIRDTSYENLEAYNYVKPETFYHSDGSTDIIFILTFVDNKLEAIILKFPELLLDFRYLDRVASFVKEVRDSFLKNYDHNLVTENCFFFEYDYRLSSNWIGLLKLEDKAGDKIHLMWDGYQLAIVYISSTLNKIIETESKKAKNQQEKRL